MKMIELIIFNREIMERLQEAGIRLDDARYVDLYLEYVAMQRNGCKMSYIAAVLSKKYAVSERKVYGLLARFKSDCKNLAV